MTTEVAFADKQKKTKTKKHHQTKNTKGMLRGMKCGDYGIYEG